MCQGAWPFFALEYFYILLMRRWEWCFLRKILFTQSDPTELRTTGSLRSTGSNKPRKQWLVLKPTSRWISRILWHIACSLCIMIAPDIHGLLELLSTNCHIDTRPELFPQLELYRPLYFVILFENNLFYFGYSVHGFGSTTLYRRQHCTEENYHSKV